MDVAGIVLAGGRSSRMGTSKAGLEWHRSTLLQRACGLLARTLPGPILVVTAPGQALPVLPSGVTLVEDPHEGRGPVQGLAAGLAAAADLVPAAYVSGTDMPFLHPAFVRFVVGRLDAGADVALPHVGGVAQPLAAAYRTSVAATAQRLVDRDHRRFANLFAQCSVRHIEEATLRADDAIARADPELESVLSIDDLDAYERARSRPGPRVTIERTGALVRETDDGARPVRCATLGAAALAAGIELDASVAVSIGGVAVPGDAGMPLVTGDHVTFAPATAGVPAP